MIARLLLLLSLVVSTTSWAADPQSLKPGEILRGRFVQDRYMAGFNKPVRSEGRFILAPGRGLLWQGEAPFPMVTAITPAGIVQSVDGKETMRLSAAKVPFLARLYDMMSGAMAGDWRALEGEFEIARQGGTDGTRVTLTPRSQDTGTQPFRSLAARMVRYVEEVDVVKTAGDRDHLTFHDQRVETAPLAADEAALFDAATR